MDKSFVLAVIVGNVMAVIWRVVFVNVLKGAAGIGVGICFGVALSLVSGLFLSKRKK